MNERLPQEAIETDHTLEKSAESASEQLAKHRWHWTLDESNQERVTFAQYARDVGRNKSTIREYANAHLIYQKNDRSFTWDSAVRRAQVSSETEAVTEAIADARNLSFRHVHDSRPDEVKRVRRMAQERAEETGAPVEEAARQVAMNIVKAEKGIESGDADRKRLAAESGLGFFKLEGALHLVSRDLIEALHIADEVGLEERHRDSIRELIDRLRELLNTVEAKVMGGVAVDWDSELLKIAGREI